MFQSVESENTLLAPLWLISEFGAVYKYSDSTQLQHINISKF